MMTAPAANNRPLFSAKNITSFYLDHCPKIFPESRRSNFVRKISNFLGGPKYDGRYLKWMVEEMLGNLTISHTLTNVVIPTFDLKRLQPIVFTTKDGKANAGKNALLSDVCLGTSAAPTFLQPHYFETTDAAGKTRTFDLVDGGVAANNKSAEIVTRLKCGGFTFALRMNHTMIDGEGIVQFMSAVGELARSAEVPSVPPVWERHLLSARHPPRVTCTHHEYRMVPDAQGQGFPVVGDMVQRSFFFGAAEFSALRSLLPPHLRACSSNFDLLTACLWRCRTIAIAPQPDDEVAMMLIVNSRRHFDPPLPSGYYGNVIACSTAIAGAGELSKKPLHYAVELVRKAKGSVTEEYMRSLADMMVVWRRPLCSLAGIYVVSDLTRIAFGQVDFGWGKPVYGGTAEGVAVHAPDKASFYIPFKNNKGEDGIILPICLPASAMEVFVKEIEKLLSRKTRVSITSAL